MRPALLSDAPSAEFPFVSRSFDRGGGVRMGYLDEGAGDPVVMLHGNPTWGLYFRHLVPALRDNYRCVVPDHVGCGRSDKPPLSKYDYALKSRVDDLEALLEHVGVTSGVTLVVHDWGGMIGLAYAARHPGRVVRLIASNTGCGRLPPGKRLPWTLKLGRNTALGRWLILYRNAFCRAAASWCVTRKPLAPAVRELYLAPYDSPANRVAVWKFVQTIPLAPGDPGFDVVEHVERSLPGYAAVPTLLLWGMRDFVFDRHFFEQWKHAFPHAEAHAWPDCGHYLFEDAPDEVVARVQRFLAAHPLPASS